MEEKTLTKVTFNADGELILVFDHKYSVFAQIGNGETSSDVMESLSLLLTDIQNMGDED